jgi:NDP-sugar pyrophosphorylase family protein
MVKEAVILAAGAGKRMKNGTSDQIILSTPKPLLKINGKPIISRKIEELIDAGFEVFVIVDRRDLKKFKRELDNYKVKFIIQGEERGTAAALFAAKGMIKSPFFLVMMGDDISNLNVRELLDDNQPAVFGFEIADVSGYGVLISNNLGEVTDIVEKQRNGKGLANTGIYVMPREFFDVYKEIPIDEKSGEKFLTYAVKLLREKGFKFKVKKISFWFGINTPEQLKEAESYIKTLNTRSLH